MGRVRLIWAFTSGVTWPIRGNASSHKKENIMKLTRNLGMLLLAIYLILVGVSAFISLGQLSIVVAILAIAAGILILIGR